MWVEIEESELTDNLRKFLQFRCREARETEWLKSDKGATIWGCSDVYNLPGVKYEVISFLANEDAYVLRYWKEDKPIYTGTGSDYLDCLLGVGGFEKYGPIEK